MDLVCAFEKPICNGRPRSAYDTFPLRLIYLHHTQECDDLDMIVKGHSKHMVYGCLCDRNVPFSPHNADKLDDAVFRSLTSPSPSLSAECDVNESALASASEESTVFPSPPPFDLRKISILNSPIESSACSIAPSHF